MCTCVAIVVVVVIVVMRRRCDTTAVSLFSAFHRKNGVAVPSTALNDGRSLRFILTCVLVCVKYYTGGIERARETFAAHCRIKRFKQCCALAQASTIYGI